MMNSIRIAETGLSLSQRMIAAAAAGLFGLLLIYGAGFAGPSAVHNATHDTRHAFGLPCH